MSGKVEEVESPEGVKWMRTSTAAEYMAYAKAFQDQKAADIKEAQKAVDAEKAQEMYV
jgi:hypothetical protein